MNLKIILPLLFTFLIIPFVFYFTKSTVFLRTSQSTKEYASHEVNSGFKGDYNREVNNVLPPYEDMKISIVIPAHNEERRIERTLRTYYSFFQQKKHLKTAIFSSIFSQFV